MTPGHVFRVELASRVERAADWSPRLVWDAEIVDAFGGIRTRCHHGHSTTAAARECGRASLEAMEQRAQRAR